MKIAVIYEDKQVFVEFSPDEFSKLLNEKINSGKSVDEAMEQIIKELKMKTLTI